VVRGTQAARGNGLGCVHTLESHSDFLARFAVPTELMIRCPYAVEAA
jgi:hypothetical protein